ncbi:zinc ribbon domain-containing protein [Cellulomonas cellasea]|uniref:Ribosomal protein L40E n=1 Tax=Cellulomonas cellasea TaxID=43670 RepID=A0A7W4UHY4_9CELL|nr:zinc ribbon domain-containing protein [Cellulomonas cellasea]MBB2924050.1 ribosomal protein L40E [Cellulomonas cellasea]
MLICTTCGTRNEDDEHFCAECGAYLAWEGERVEDRAAEEPAAPVVVTPTVGSPTVATPTTPVAEPPPATPTAHRPTVTTPVPEGAPQPATTRSRAEALLARPVDPPTAQPRHDGPAPVLPGARAPKPRTVRPAPVDEPPRNPGDQVCGQCGAGNVATRKFCRRCGESLADAPVVLRRSWRERVLTRRPRELAAGARPRVRRRPFRARWVVVPAVLVLLVGGVWTQRERLSDLYDTVVDRAVGNGPVNPAQVVASSEAEGRGAAAAMDGATNQSWAPAQPGEGVGEFLEMRFDEPFRLAYVRVFSGASTQQPEFLAQGRPEEVALTLLSADGTQTTEQLRLADAVGGQEFPVGADDVVAARLTVLSAYPVPEGASVSLGEVEFLGRP